MNQLGDNTPRDKRGKKIAQKTGRHEVLAELASIDGSHWQLCLHPLEHRRDLNPDLSSLLANPMANNPFFNPAVLAASRDRITQNRVHQMVLWETFGEKSVPRLSIPVAEQTPTLIKHHTLNSLTHPYAPLGDPLIAPDSDTMEAVSHICAQFIDLVKLAFQNDMPPLILSYVDELSPLASALNRVKAESGIAVGKKSLGARASIIPKDGVNTHWQPSKKRRREYARLEKKLQPFGDLTYEKVSEPFDILLRLEEYLLLETRGWKGRKGTSIHAIKRDAAFARQAVSDLARAGQSEIYTMRLNDVAIASTILFHQHGCYYPWKTCFNETFAKYSPGTQLMLKLTDDITARPDFRYADSLAHFGRSWMTNLWPDETVFDTYVIAQTREQADTLTDRMELGEKSKSFLKRLLRRK